MQRSRDGMKQKASVAGLKQVKGEVSHESGKVGKGEIQRANSLVRSVVH